MEPPACCPPAPSPGPYSSCDPVPQRNLLSDFTMVLPAPWKLGPSVCDFLLDLNGENTYFLSLKDTKLLILFYSSPPRACVESSSRYGALLLSSCGFSCLSVTPGFMITASFMKYSCHYLLSLSSKLCQLFFFF